MRVEILRRHLEIRVWCSAQRLETKDRFGKKHSNGTKTYTTGWDYLFNKFLERWAGPRPGSRDSPIVSIYAAEDKRTQQRRMRKSSQWEIINSEDNDKHMKIFLQKIMASIRTARFWILMDAAKFPSKMSPKFIT